MQVRKAIIPAAGFGTRFLPATKAMPKEMMPIVDKPAIQFVVEEAVAAGIESILIVTGKNKRAIEDHFDHVTELETKLAEKGKSDALEDVVRSAEAEIYYIRQKQALGVGDAIWSARHFIGNEPFAVLLGDSIIDSAEPCLGQLMACFNKTGTSIIGVHEVPESETGKYGIIDPGERENGMIRVNGIVEKPEAGAAPSTWAGMGRYILTPRIFDFLKERKVGSGGEIQLTDAMQEMIEMEPLYACEFQGRRFDIGESWGFLETNIEYALKRPELRKRLMRLFREKLDRENL
jgi:UTP--glucose-1-phosphate uridylyltransferase